MRTEQAWSFISAKPLLIRDLRYNIDLCYWNGIGMTRNFGRMIVGNVWCGIGYSDSVKEAAWYEFKRAYLSNAFMTRNWDEALNENTGTSYFFLLKTLVNKEEFLDKIKNEYSAQEALRWFEEENVIISENNEVNENVA